MNEYCYSICEPLKKDVLKKGIINTELIVPEFKNFNWDNYLAQIKTAQTEEIFFSPSLEFENKTTKHGITFSAVGVPSDYLFYVFYKRPKKVKKLFGIIESINENYMSSLEDKTEDEALKYLHAFLDNDIDFLERTFK